MNKIIPLNKKLVAIIWPFCTVVLLLLIFGVLGMKTLTSVRAYVSGESYWTRAQKEAVYYLNLYARTHTESDYRKFVKELQVPLGDKLARESLQQADPDLDKARQGFLMGRNDPNDVPGMIVLFLLFQHTDLLKPSIDYWTEGDKLIDDLLAQAVKLRQQIKAGNTSPEQIRPIQQRINSINLTLTPLEDGFSAAIGLASRRAQTLVIALMCLMTAIMTALGVLFTRRLVRKEALAATALHESEERWKFALLGARDIVWEWHVIKREISYLNGWRTMLDYEDETLHTTTAEWEKLVHPDDLPKVQSASSTYLLDAAGYYTVEHRLRCQDGRYKWVLTRGKAVSYTKAGEVERLIGTHTDIDEIKRIEAALRESDSNQRALLDAMIDGVFVAQDNRFVFANPVLPTMLGYSHAEFVGLTFEQVVVPAFLQAWKERFAARVGEGIEPDKHFQVRFLTKGGQDSVWFDLHASRVVFHGKRSVLGIVRDVSRQKEAEETIWRQANFDELTHLPNRRMFRDRLEQEIKEAERGGSMFAVLFMDLDHFKEVNDALGHSIGDALLKEAAARLLTCVRDTDIVARLGGDEFVVLLRHIEDSTGLDKSAKHILEKMSRPFELEQEMVYVSASIGITLYPNDAASFDDLLKNADQAMYSAKDEGRNRYNYFMPSMQATAKARMRLANDLRHACERQEFKLLYQPIIEIATGQIRKAEALIRWHHPTLGVINPGEFIAIAEDTGTIFEMGDWAFQEAAVQAKKWRKSLHPDFQISVNKSPVQFRSQESGWLKLLADHRFAGQSVIVEITENLLLDESSQASERLKSFRKAGVQIAIDDFGTGYSSLSYLRKYDIDYIKIDQSFVRNITAGGHDMGLCEIIILMAHKLGMKVVAEGVETMGQLAMLADAGCDYAQGYLFSKPVSVKDFERIAQLPDMRQLRTKANQ